MNEMPTIPEYLLRLSDGCFGIEAFSLFEESERVQRELLGQILRSASHTEFGKRYDFASIHDVNHFGKGFLFFLGRISSLIRIGWSGARRIYCFPVRHNSLP